MGGRALLPTTSVSLGTSALATACTIFAPSLAIPPASYLHSTARAACAACPDERAWHWHCLPTRKESALQPCSRHPAAAAQLPPPSCRRPAAAAASPLADHEPRDVLQEEERHAALRAELHKVRALLRRLTKQDTWAGQGEAA